MYSLLLIDCLLYAATLFTLEGPTVLHEGEGASTPKQPQACVAKDGTAHWTFGIGDQVYYGQFAKERSTKPSMAFQVPNMSLGMRRGPRIAWTKHAIVISAIGGPQGKGKDGDVLAYRSVDEGLTWSGPIRVNDEVSSAREGLHAMTASEDGDLWCVWLDLRSKKTELYASRSQDGGTTWSKNQRIYRSPGGSICECCHPSIVVQDHRIHVLFRNSLDGDRDMYLISSDDNGQTFGNAIRLGIQHWKLNACPMDGGMLATDPSGEVKTVWRRQGTLFVAGPNPREEIHVGIGEQPWIAVCADQTRVVWTHKREGDLMLMGLKSGEPQKIAENARDPVIVASIGATSTAYLFWEQKRENRTQLMGMTLPCDGP